MKEVVGNLVITDTQKYLQNSSDPLTYGEALANAIDQLSTTVSYDFNHVRRSVVDAYEGRINHLFTLPYIFFSSAAVARKDKELAKQKLTIFENASGQKSTDSVKALVTDDVLDDVRILFFSRN